MLHMLVFRISCLFSSQVPQNEEALTGCLLHGLSTWRKWIRSRIYFHPTGTVTVVFVTFSGDGRYRSTTKLAGSCPLWEDGLITTSLGLHHSSVQALHDYRERKTYSHRGFRVIHGLSFSRQRYFSGKVNCPHFIR